MKKGFSLMEILAIIAIISLMVVFTMPSILKLYTEAEKKNFKSEMQNLIRVAEIGYGNTSLNTLYIADTIYEFVDGETIIDGNISIEFSGSKPQNGTLTITKEGEISFRIHKDKYCAIKRADSKEIFIVKSTVTECTEGSFTFTPEICFITNVNEAPEDIRMIYEEIPDFSPEMQRMLEAAGIIYEDEIGAREAVIYYYNYQNPLCSSDVIIPEQIDGKNVIGIGLQAFIDVENYEPMGITSVEFPNTIKKIGTMAFAYNFIESLNLPSSLIAIGFQAFEGNLISSIEIPSNVKYLSGFSFNPITSIQIPESVTNIEMFAFLGIGLTGTLEIPSNVEYIGEEAFIGNFLTGVTIKSSVLNMIDYEAFAYNNILEENALICDLSNDVIIEETAFKYNGLDGETTIVPTFTNSVCPN